MFSGIFLNNKNKGYTDLTAERQRNVAKFSKTVFMKA